MNNNYGGSSLRFVFYCLILIAGLSILLFGTEGGKYVLLVVLVLIITVSVFS